MLNLYTSFVIGVLGAWADGQTHSYDSLYEASPAPGSVPLRVLSVPGRVEIEHDGVRASVRVDEVSRFGASACVDGSGAHASFAARIDDQWNLAVVEVASSRVELHALSAPPASRALMWRDEECVAATLDALGTLYIARGASDEQRDGVVAEVPDLGELARGLVLERVGESLIAGDDLGGLTLVRDEELVELAIDDRALWPIAPDSDGASAHLLSRQGTLYRIDLDEGSVTSILTTRAPTTTGLVVWRSRSADLLAWADRTGRLHTFDGSNHTITGAVAGEIRQPLLAASIEDEFAADVQLTGIAKQGALVTWRLDGRSMHSRIDTLHARAQGPIALRQLDASRPAEIVIPTGAMRTTIRPLAGGLARGLEHEDAVTSIHSSTLTWTAPVITPTVVAPPATSPLPPKHERLGFAVEETTGCSTTGSKSGAPLPFLVSMLLVGLIGGLRARERRP